MPPECCPSPAVGQYPPHSGPSCTLSIKEDFLDMKANQQKTLRVKDDHSAAVTVTRGPRAPEPPAKTGSRV